MRSWEYFLKQFLKLLFKTCFVGAGFFVLLILKSTEHIDCIGAAPLEMFENQETFFLEWWSE